MRRGMVIDLEKCIGCRSCAVACKQHNAQPAGSWWNRVVTPGSDRHLTASAPENLYFLPIHCQHCQNAPCVKVCPVGATYQTDDGTVLIDFERCIGCRYCMVACPFYVPAFEYEKAFTPRVLKCTFCSHRTSRGQAPACVEACPYGVMTFGKRGELLELAHERITKHPHRYVHHVYGETEVGGTSWLYLSPVSFEKLGFQADVPHFAIPELTHGALSVVPMVILLWPAVLGGL